ncbi:MAG: acetyl-CoA carboxylase biotin carboxyl carrier protein [Treponema sp.]|jgi:acetyl-CoA carboxylase biotin carboxyl carrier protein|nr:acetyl-CoA carboxylase biotin carboxyl carrier protein [Treponema sp.]
MDEKFILTVIEKFNSTNVTELELDDKNTRLVLRKERAPAPAASAALSGRETAEENSVRLGIAANTTAEASDGGEKIKSPIVATFYSAPGPDAPPFVKPGAKVKAGQTLCILEAMKMMNHLEAEFDCEITEVHASSGDLVEYGQALFTVKRK